MTDFVENACAIWDFRFSKNEYSHTEIMTQLAVVAKTFVFQLEQGDGGYLHYQGRMSLKKKRRMAEKHILLALFNNIKPQYLAVSANATALKGDQFYVTKEDTRVAGPWTENALPKYIPRQYRDKLDKLYPFQQTIYNSAQHFNDRDINVIVCDMGCKGKSTIAHVSRLFGKGVVVPSINDAKELIATCCDMAESMAIRDPGPFFIDMPRAMTKERLFGIWSAVEQIKSGYLYDTRYKFHYYDIDSPAIWVFTNDPPDMNMLSRDRWHVWTIGDANELIPYEELY